MALINCPECGKEISDTCESCVHCGYKLSNDVNQKNMQVGKKKISIIVILLAVVILIGIVIVSILILNSIQENKRLEQERQEQISMQEEEERQRQEEERQKQAKIEAQKLTYEEKVCYYAIQYFETILKNPSSLQIYDIKISVSLDVTHENKEPDEHYSKYAVYLNYSAENGYGVNNRESYYIIMADNSATEDNIFSSQKILSGYYYDQYSIEVSVDKIKYALEHPEVLDY